MSSIIIIYGSTSGNTEMVCYKTTQVLQSLGHEVKLQRAENSTPNDIAGHDLCILAASTYGHGIIQDHMIPFIKEMKTMEFAGQKFAVIGLGDSKYDNHYSVESAFILERVIKKTSGELFAKSLLINGSPIWQMARVFDWANEINKTLKSLEK